MRIFSRRAVWLISLFSFVAFAGGCAGVLVDRVFLPSVATNPFLSQWGIFKKASENTVIINKTEQVIVREDDSIDSLAAAASPTVVNILSLKKGAYGKTPDVLQGSGVLMTNDGLIATFRTVLLQNASYKVLLYNGSSYDAQYVGSDSLTGLAYLKIAVANLPAVSFADASGVRAGEKLILIANAAEEYRNRYSTGLLGSVDKTFNTADGAVALSNRWEGVFLVDAANMSPYIGGPAINYDGQLVGIVGAVFRGNIAQPFLLPVDAVKNALERQVSGTLELRPGLEIPYVSITKAYALSHDISRDRGALILGLPYGGSPARSPIPPGIRMGDIVVAINGQEINLDYSLPVALGNFKRGDIVTFRLLRDGREQDIAVTL